MKDLLEINWWQIIKAYKYFRERDYLPKELKGHITLGHNKKDYVDLFAYIIENMDEERRRLVPKRFIQLYNWIFIDEHESKTRRGYESSYGSVVKNSKFGHSEGTQAFIIDEMLFEGKHSDFDMARAIGSTQSRVRTHIHSVRKKFKETYEIITVKRSLHIPCVYYVRERKKDDPKREGKKLTVRTFDDIEPKPEKSKSKRNS